MPNIDVIVWESGADGAAALRQLSEGKFTIEKALEYRQFCDWAAGNPFAICLWEVNLSNWETRVAQLVEFTQMHPRACVAIASSDLPPAVIEVFQEVGAALIVRDRLEARSVLHLAARRKESRPAEAPPWREVVETPIDWLDREQAN